MLHKVRRNDIGRALNKPDGFVKEVHIVWYGIVEG